MVGRLVSAAVLRSVALPSVGSSRVRWVGVGIAVLLALLLPVRLAPAQDAANGEAIYRAWCLECHGAEGRGDGPAAASRRGSNKDRSCCRDRGTTWVRATRCGRPGAESSRRTTI